MLFPAGESWRTAAEGVRGLVLTSHRYEERRRPRRDAPAADQECFIPFGERAVDNPSG